MSASLRVGIVGAPRGSSFIRGFRTLGQSWHTLGKMA